MAEYICLNEIYSTTRVVSKEPLFRTHLKNPHMREWLAIDIVTRRKAQGVAKATCKPFGSKQKSTEEKFETTLFLPENIYRRGEGGLRMEGYFKQSYKQSEGRWYAVDRDGNLVDEIGSAIVDSKLEALPLITVITVVYNGAEHLEQTIKSVIEQSYPNIEYIVIDGGSTDGTLDIVKRYEEFIDYWVSEPDEGIYDAMNKGLKLATGDYIMFLNADDALCQGSIPMLLGAVQRGECDYSMGAVKKIPSNIVVKPLYPLERGKLFFGMPYPHVGALIPLKVYKSVGLFDTAYKICADYDMAVRIHLYGYRACRAEGIVAEILEGGVSASWRSKSENLDIAISHGMKKSRAYLHFFKSLLKEIGAKILPMPVKRAIWKGKKSRYSYEK